MVRGRAELVLGVIVTAVGAYALSVALRLTLFGKNHVPGPGLFPTLITIGMLILGVLLAVLSVRDAVRSRPASVAESVEATDDESAAEGASQRQRLLRAGIVFLCYAIVMPLMPILGFVPAAALLVLLVLIGVERRLVGHHDREVAGCGAGGEARHGDRACLVAQPRLRGRFVCDRRQDALRIVLRACLD